MPGRGHSDERGSHAGRGHDRPSKPREVAAAPPGGIKHFTGIEEKLPTLNLGSGKDKPLEFLRIMGEYCAIKYHHVISHAFRSTPPDYGDEDEEPTFPKLKNEEKPNQLEKTLISIYINEQKAWSADQKKIKEDQRIVYALVFGQLSESSRGELIDEDWGKSNADNDLLYLIKRIRATHVAVSTGNALQDQERVRAKWYSMHMGQQESIYGFRKRVDEYQLERESVGLATIPETELVIGILNRLDEQRFSPLVETYLANKRRGIAALPEEAPTLWKELKDSQATRYNNTFIHSDSVYLSRSEDRPYQSKGRGGRGRGRGRG